MKKKITVIGGGPGGYVAAIRGAQLGAEVLLIEKENLGGTCLNVGCIPTKTLLECAHVFHEAGNSADIGIYAKPVLNWEKVQSHRREIIHRLVSGVEGLMRSNKIQVIKGTASFKDSHTVYVKSVDGKNQEIQSEYFIIATGSVPVKPSIPGIDAKACIDSTDALKLSEVPDSMIVIGGGIIGVELATAYHEFGTKVTVVESMPYILPNMDRELAEKLKKDMLGRGIAICTDTKVCAIEQDGDKTYCGVETGGKHQKLYGDKILVCVGRKANLEGLQLHNAGVKAGRVLEVDESMCTNVDHIYAVGDCNGRLMLAHAASEQGVTAAENCMGLNKTYKDFACPSGVYAAPELAGVGLTEEEVRAKNIPYKVGKFPLAANGRAMILRQSTGMVKVLVGEPYGEILGIHIYGSMATELIEEGALAMNLEATADEVIDMIHAHPTLSECLHEAALAVNGRAIHAINRK